MIFNKLLLNWKKKCLAIPENGVLTVNFQQGGYQPCFNGEKKECRAI